VVTDYLKKHVFALKANSMILYEKYAKIVPIIAKLVQEQLQTVLFVEATEMMMLLIVLV
jgi:hypothetical protein